MLFSSFFVARVCLIAVKLYISLSSADVQLYFARHDSDVLLTLSDSLSLAKGISHHKLRGSKHLFSYYSGLFISTMSSYFSLHDTTELVPDNERLFLCSHI